MSIMRCVQPPVDRNMAPGAPGGPTDVYAHVTKETDAGIHVTGAKVVATGSALTHFTFVGHVGLLPVQDKNYAVVFLVPTNAPGVKFICRVSNEQRAAVLGSPFDYPLSSRLDENDAIFIMDDVFVPWENVFVYGDIDKANSFFPRSGFVPRFQLHGCTRLAVKLDFITGLLIKATETAGTRGFRGVEANIGEVITWRNAMWALSDAMAKSPEPWTDGFVLPGSEPGAAYHVLGPEAYVQVKHQIEKTVASSLIYLNSHARDFKAPELRKYLDRYVRGSGGVTAVERVKLMKLLWDAIGTEFGARHELYEINYSGSHEEIRRFALLGSRRRRASTSAGRASPTPAWPNTTSTAGRCPTSSIRTTSIRCARPGFESGRLGAVGANAMTKLCGARRDRHRRVRRAGQGVVAGLVVW